MGENKRPLDFRITLRNEEDEKKVLEVAESLGLKSMQLLRMWIYERLNSLKQ